MSPLLLVVLAAGGNPFLAEGKAHYDALDYEKCVVRLQQAARWKDSTPTELRDVELYAGLCQFELGKQRAAVEHWRTALRIDEYTGLPGEPSPKAEALFLEVKEALRQPSEPFPDEDLPDDAPTKLQLAPTETAVAPAPPLWKRHAAPIALSAVATAALLAGIGLGLQATALESQANLATFESDFRQLGGAARGNALAANVAYGVAASAALSAGLVFLLSTR